MMATHPGLCCRPRWSAGQYLKTISAPEKNSLTVSSQQSNKFNLFCCSYNFLNSPIEWAGTIQVWNLLLNYYNILHGLQIVMHIWKTIGYLQSPYVSLLAKYKFISQTCFSADSKTTTLMWWTVERALLHPQTPTLKWGCIQTFFLKSRVINFSKTL